MLSGGRNLVRFASRQRNGTKLLAAASQARCPAVQIKVEQDLHTNLERDVSFRLFLGFGVLKIATFNGNVYLNPCIS